ncbi:MAG: AMP-binding protein, partial [bacterium]|nr:AMP-binding protein [bacterium]
IYTSGSTGKPKGIVVEHKSVVNLVNWFAKTYNLQPGAKALQLTDFTFDPSIEDIFGTLLHGATLHIAHRELLVDREKFARYVAENNINIVNFIPTVLAELLGGHHKLESLQAVICGGENLEEETKKQLLRKGYPLYNHYGPTEITVDALVSRCGESTVNLGRPIANVGSYILNNAGKLLPPGIPGELCISGAGVARGYLNDSQLTCEKFTVNPFVHGDRLFKTGDLAVRLKDGTIRFMGRIDKRQIKLRGFRIELEDIRKQLIAHWEVKEAAVTVLEKSDGETFLAAYVVLNDTLQDNEFEMSDLREYLVQRLPDYMVPSFLVRINQIPLTTGGKVNYQTLLELKTGIEDNYVPPRDVVEEALVRLWSEVVDMDKDKIGIDTNFFELGGHSLKATVLVSRIHKTLNVVIPLVELFKAPTVRKLAEYAKSVMTEEYCGIEAVEKKEYYVLSSAQRRLYLTQQIDPQSTAYNIVEELIMRTEPDKEQWEKALKNLIHRHASLRTSFHMMDGQLVQKVHEKVDFVIRYFDMTEGNTKHAVEDFVRPFDLSKAPLVRAGLVKVDSDKYVMMVDLHHIISDGISHKVLENDFTALYSGRELPPLRIQYKDYAQWQYDMNRSGKLKSQEDYWLTIFTEPIPVLELPTDFLRPQIQSFEGAMMDFFIEPAHKEALKLMAMRQDATLYIVVLSAFFVLMSKLSGQEDIVIGSDSAGRRHADLEKLIGMFVNTMGLRNAPRGEERFCDFVREVRARTLDAFDNQDYQFDTLVEKVVARENAGRNPLFDVMYCFYNYDERLVSLEKDRGETENPEPQESLRRNSTTMFDLTLHTQETPYGLDFTFEYNTKLFKERRIEKFISYFKEIVSAVVEDNEIRLKDIDISHDLVTAKQQVTQMEFGF